MSGNLTYFNIDSPSLKKCDFGYRLCGPQKSKYYQTCIPKEISCPITNLQIVPISSIDSNII